MKNYILDSRDSVNHALGVLKRITKILKIIPFLYALVYIISMIVYLSCSETASAVVDAMFYVSPITCSVLFYISYILRLCNWYRLQCALPCIYIAVTVFDLFLPLSMFGAAVTVISAVIVFSISLVNAYHVFVKPKPKGALRTGRNGKY